VADDGDAELGGGLGLRDEGGHLPVPFVTALARISANWSW
jgi:hypothetical protein